MPNHRPPPTGRRRERETPAYVRNAANPRQVKWAERREQERLESFVVSLAEVMHTTAGRRVFGELLERAGLYRSSYDNSGSATYFNEGRRNFGLEIQAMLVQAGEETYELMEREMRAYRRSLEREASAVQQASTPADSESPTEG
jgi:hypothetical protein